MLSVMTESGRFYLLFPCLVVVVAVVVVVLRGHLQIPVCFYSRSVTQTV